MFQNQLTSIQSSIRYLTKQKDELELQINILKAQNNELTNKIFKMEEDNEGWTDRKDGFNENIKQLELKNVECEEKVKNLE